MSAGFFWTLLGYGVGVAAFVLAARRRSLATEGIGWLALAAFGGGILGAKVAQLAFGASASGGAVSPLLVLDPRLGGRTLIAGITGGWIGVEWAKRRLGIYRSTGDLFALALPAGEAVGRIGCFFYGCCFGTPSTIPWATYQHGAWRHPSQFYLACSAALIAVFLWSRGGHWRREGDLWKTYLVLFGTSRFVVEFWRERDLTLGLFSTAQIASVLIAAAGLWLLVKRSESGARRKVTAAV
jgi:phosphatidylglycerol:prolipoprotein diacylglycerol transferase